MKSNAPLDSASVCSVDPPEPEVGSTGRNANTDACSASSMVIGVALGAALGTVARPLAQLVRCMIAWWNAAVRSLIWSVNRDDCRPATWWPSSTRRVNSPSTRLADSTSSWESTVATMRAITSVRTPFSNRVQLKWALGDTHTHMNSSHTHTHTVPTQGRGTHTMEHTHDKHGYPGI